jgi:hypothetical protein
MSRILRSVEALDCTIPISHYIQILVATTAPKDMGAFVALLVLRERIEFFFSEFLL